MERDNGKLGRGSIYEDCCGWCRSSDFGGAHGGAEAPESSTSNGITDTSSNEALALCPLPSIPNSLSLPMLRLLQSSELQRAHAYYRLTSRAAPASTGCLSSRGSRASMLNKHVSCPSTSPIACKRKAMI